MNYRRILPGIILLFAALILAVPTHAAVLACYSFDTDFSDGSGNGNHLAVNTGTPTITTTAGEYKYGGAALDIDSTTSSLEYLDLTTPFDFAAPEAWSVSFWARRRPGTDNRSGMVIGDPSNTVDFIWLSNNSSQVQGLRFRTSSNANANFGGFPDDNAYHHWVVIADGAGTVTAYHDNVVQTPVTSIVSDFSITSVGSAYTGAVQSMDGQIDELYIFDEAIDAATVGSLYDGTFVVPEPGTMTLALLAIFGVTVLHRRRRH